MQNMWMVRAGRNAFLIDNFRKNNYVAIGWNKIGDIGRISSREKIKGMLQEKYSYEKRNELNIDAGQISRFLFDFKKGDYVLSYDPTNRQYLVGEIESDYEYNDKLSEYHHVRRVKWLGEVSRDKLSIAPRNTLGAISTIFRINETAAKEIMGILEGKEKAPAEIVEEEEEESLKEDMVSRANELIKDKIVKLDWDDLQELVAGILRAMGYKTIISEGGPDRGKDIEASPDGLMLTEPCILVEVKHRSGQMGSKDVRSFTSVLRQQKGLYVPQEASPRKLDTKLSDVKNKLR